MRDSSGISIGIDARSLRSGPAGVATYVGNLISLIPELVPIDYPAPRNNFLWNQLRVPQATWQQKWRVFHAPGYTAPLWNFCPSIVSVHDVSYLVSEAFYPYKLDRFRRAYYVASMKKAKRILVPSDFTRQELIRVLPGLGDRVRKVLLGVSPEFRSLPEAGRETRERFFLASAVSSARGRYPLSPECWKDPVGEP